MTYPLVVLAALSAVLPLAAEDGFRWPSDKKAAVVLTYDDGVDVHLDHVVPDLEAAGLRGTFYVPGHSSSLRQRMPEWRAIARRGHELGNHSVFHPCLRVSLAGERRDWLAPERELEKYSVSQMDAELAAMNTLLFAVDGEAARTYAFTCSDHLAGGTSYVDKVRPLFLAARTGETQEIPHLRTVDVHFVPSWPVINVSGDDMIAFAEKALRAGSLAVFMFHGVGGGHSINVDREAHRKLLAWLTSRKDDVWTDSFRNVMTHVIAERKRLGWENARR